MDWATNWTGVQRGPSLKKQEAGAGWGGHEHRRGGFKQQQKPDTAPLRGPAVQGAFEQWAG